jgi:hypothetical protein
MRKLAKQGILSLFVDHIELHGELRDQHRSLVEREDDMLKDGNLKGEELLRATG